MHAAVIDLYRQVSALVEPPELGVWRVWTFSEGLPYAKEKKRNRRNRRNRRNHGAPLLLPISKTEIAEALNAKRLGVTLVTHGIRVSLEPCVFIACTCFTLTQVPTKNEALERQIAPIYPIGERTHDKRRFEITPHYYRVVFLPEQLKRQMGSTKPSTSVFKWSYLHASLREPFYCG